MIASNEGEDFFTFVRKRNHSVYESILTLSIHYIDIFPKVYLNPLFISDKMSIKMIKTDLINVDFIKLKYSFTNICLICLRI